MSGTLRFGSELEHDWQALSVMVRVDGPGELRVSEPGLVAVYRAGQMRSLRPFDEVPLVGQWFGELTEELANRLVLFTRTTTGPEPFNQRVRHLVRYGWSVVLGTAIELRRGGAFVILPFPAIDSHIHLKYPGQSLGGLGLDQDIIQYVRNEPRDGTPSSLPSQKDLSCELHNWSNRKNSLLGKARAFGNFSGVDGCVVLDRALNFLGFGGEIRVDPTTAERSPRTLVDQQTGQPILQETLKRFGTRHQSAYRLCKVVGHAIVFVVSQDGDLRVFSSNYEHVYFAEALNHLVTRAGQC